MSRHRNVRRLVKEQDYYDDDVDHYDDYDEEEEEVYHDHDTNDDDYEGEEDEDEDLDVKVAMVLSIIGNNTRCSRDEALQALNKNQMDARKAAAWLTAKALPVKQASAASKPTGKSSN